MWAIARRAPSLAKGRAAELIGRAIVVALATLLVPIAGVGAPLAGRALFGIYAKATESRPGRGKRGRVLAMVASGSALPLVATISGLAESTLPPFLGQALGVLVSAIVGVVLMPLHLASVTLLVEDRSLEEAFARVIVATTGRGRAVALTGALQGVATVGLGVVAWELAHGSAGLHVALFCFLLTLASLTQALVSVAAYETLVKDHTGDFLAPRLGRIGLVLAPGALALAAAMLFALVAPLPAWIDRPLEDLDASLAGGARIEAGTASGLAITGQSGAVVVSVADGGGCGTITGFTSIASPLALVPTTFRGRTAFEVGRRGHGRVAFVDEDGVRLDDTIGDRLEQRVGPAILELLAIATLLIALLIVWLRSATRTATLLGSMPIAEVPDAALVALTGRLRLGDGAKITPTTRGTSRVSGSVHFESPDGALLVQVDEGEHALGQARREVKDGAPAFVVAEASELRSGTHRSAARGRAMLIGLGTIANARSAFLDRESRRLVWLGVPASLAMAAAAMIVVAS